MLSILSLKVFIIFVQQLQHVCKQRDFVQWQVIMNERFCAG